MRPPHLTREWHRTLWFLFLFYLLIHLFKVPNFKFTVDLSFLLLHHFEKKNDVCRISVRFFISYFLLLLYERIHFFLYIFSPMGPF